MNEHFENRHTRTQKIYFKSLSKFRFLETMDRSPENVYKGDLFQKAIQCLAGKRLSTVGKILRNENILLQNEEFIDIERLMPNMMVEVLEPRIERKINLWIHPGSTTAQCLKTFCRVPIPSHNTVLGPNNWANSFILIGVCGSQI